MRIIQVYGPVGGSRPHPLLILVSSVPTSHYIVSLFLPLLFTALRLLLLSFPPSLSSYAYSLVLSIAAPHGTNLSLPIAPLSPMWPLMPCHSIAQLVYSSLMLSARLCWPS